MSPPGNDVDDAVVEGDFREAPLPEASAGAGMVKREPGMALQTAPRPSLAMVRQVSQDLAVMQQLVGEVLTPQIDWGVIPGVPGRNLFDPGAQKIFAAFNVYAGERRIINMEDDASRISICVEVPLIARETGRVVATGVGAASTLETKYKYRWVDDPKAWGLDELTIAGLKTKKSDSRTMYRVPNPEHSELLNTIIKIASKRAEVDAAESLPGVATVLRQLFERPAASGASVGQAQDPYAHFWGEMRRMGISQEAVHARYGSVAELVKSRGGAVKDVLQGLVEEMRKSPPPQPKGELGDEVSKLWKEASDLLRGSPITAEMVANWWAMNKQVEIRLKDFESPTPPPTLPAGAVPALKEFIRSIVKYMGRGGGGR